MCRQNNVVDMDMTKYQNTEKKKDIRIINSSLPMVILQGNYGLATGSKSRIAAKGNILFLCHYAHF